MNGQLVISLDFEKFWGVFDSKTLESYREELDNVDIIVDRLIDIADKYKVKLTFATVGFLFHNSKKELLDHLPKQRPTYDNKNHSPYELLESINTSKYQYYFAKKGIDRIKSNPNHELGTHTYCHYYCLEDGQTTDQFAEDLKMVVSVGKLNNVEIKSIVFPRNQVSADYLQICETYGIIAYRGTENHTIYKPRPYKNSKILWHRFMRIGDAYFNLTGRHTYDLAQLKGSVVNIPSSYFLRPYNSKLSFLEPYKLRRVIKGMTKAAKEKKLYHLWFHPHNFGKNVEDNFKTFERILKTYSSLHKDYNFESTTMSELAQLVKNKK